uniref:NADH-ubiquinone oxidoreductase chain 2 n=1 Tax=Curculionidae sp. BMNH 1040049 TaxID=1903777 RepID=A0A343A5W3_9CUCU|nr:NADH dehydrogenase subunit 2 [Curculionidae sp. BMNH 1040049]
MKVFIFLVLSSSLLTASSMSWITCWVGLEINLLAFLPLMGHSKDNLSTEAMTKYFITQSMASMLLIFSILLTTFPKFYKTVEPSTFMFLALSLKLGLVPFHFWLPETASGLSWKINFILMTWQKLAPFSLIMNILISTPMKMIALTAVSSSITGSLMGNNQTCLRKMMSFSSINHLGWMLSASMCSNKTWLIYYLTYSILNLNIMIPLSKMKIFYFHQLIKFNLKPLTYKISFLINFLSLSGLPPLFGFFPKWITIYSLVMLNFNFMALSLILSTLMAIYFYLQFTFSSLILMSSTTKTPSYPYFSYNNYNFMSYSAMSMSMNFSLIFIYLFYL